MKSLIEQLETNGPAIVALVRAIGEKEARWKPPSGAWSIVEIVNHLADEEVEDFRTRLRLTLEDPKQDWPAIDPERFAIERRFQERDLAESIERFARERAASIDWLRTLPREDDAVWDNVHTHPRAGSLGARDLLASWAAHDLLHLRQIAKRRYEYIRTLAAPATVDYAGSW